MTYVMAGAGSSFVARHEQLPVLTKISRGSSKPRFVRPVGGLPFVIPGSGACAYHALEGLLVAIKILWVARILGKAIIPYLS
ncbi:hypothetical protein GGP41_008927 [Bipolaris sorokiniana]|uniref:Uncharacterized protein n=1 Tax=Cochliobolus sativus TaxID=45130 RepID=A0A8H5ZCG4_COCSA|nr:hypothetical protein GGP41_008927 [Bipolaris sorokiniana]